MMKSLIITNGDTAADLMRQARINGEILCWRDILHEGPVPITPTLEALSAIRVDFLAGGGWGEPEEIAGSFAERDAIMRSLSNYSDITLWFEHRRYRWRLLYLLRRLELSRQKLLLVTGSLLTGAL
jgi:hypothetical protein